MAAAALLAGAPAWAVGVGAAAELLGGSGENLFRWSAGAASNASQGLRGGISWAVEPSFCGTVIALFPEETRMHENIYGLGDDIVPRILDCNELLRKMRMAMAAWSSANVNLRFFEVTPLCAGRWRPVSSAGVNLTDPTTWGSVPLACDLAELVIGTYRPEGTSGSGVNSSRALLTTSPEAPLVGGADFQSGGWLNGDYTTNQWTGGSAPLVSAKGGTIVGARIELSVGEGQCWWHDMDWCSGILQAEVEGKVDTHAFMSTFRWITFLIGLALILFLILLDLYKILQVTALAWDTDGDGVVEFHEVWAIRSPTLALALPDASLFVAAAVRASLSVLPWLRPQVRQAFRAFFDYFGGHLRLVDESFISSRKLEPRAAAYGACLSLRGASILFYLICFAFLFIPSNIDECIFKPCLDCDDFHATITKQLGVVLGLFEYEMSKVPTAANETNPLSHWLYVTNRTLGYNCSLTLQNVELQYNLGGLYSPPPSAVTQRTYQGYPRYVCPTDDDADALRVLYPECDELLGCETMGGGENYAYLLTNGSGAGPDACSRWMGPYSSSDALDSIVSYNGTNYTWTPAPFGRKVASPQCVEVFAPDWLGLLGPFRFILIVYKALLVPVIILIVLKFIGLFCLKTRCMRATRIRYERLLRTSAKRKGEIRRMTEGGQAFIVKQSEKKRGELAQSVVNKLKLATALSQSKLVPVSSKANPNPPAAVRSSPCCKNESEPTPAANALISKLKTMNSRAALGTQNSQSALNTTTGASAPSPGDSSNIHNRLTPRAGKSARVQPEVEIGTESKPSPSLEPESMPNVGLATPFRPAVIEGAGLLDDRQ